MCVCACGFQRRKFPVSRQVYPLGHDISHRRCATNLLRFCGLEASTFLNLKQHRQINLPPTKLPVTFAWTLDPLLNMESNFHDLEKTPRNPRCVLQKMGIVCAKYGYITYQHQLKGAVWTAPLTIHEKYPLEDPGIVTWNPTCSGVCFLLLPRRCQFSPQVSPASDKTVSMDSDGTASWWCQISGVPTWTQKRQASYAWSEMGSLMKRPEINGFPWGWNTATPLIGVK